MVYVLHISKDFLHKEKRDLSKNRRTPIMSSLLNSIHAVYLCEKCNVKIYVKNASKLIIKFTQNMLRNFFTPMVFATS